MPVHFRSCALVLGILFPTLAPATQFATGPVTSSTFTVALDFDGQERLVTVESKLDKSHDRISFLAVRSQSGVVEIPKHLFEDLRTPDLGTLDLSEIDAAFGVSAPPPGTYDAVITEVVDNSDGSVTVFWKFNPQL